MTNVILMLQYQRMILIRNTELKTVMREFSYFTSFLNTEIHTAMRNKLSVKAIKN